MATADPWPPRENGHSSYVDAVMLECSQGFKAVEQLILNSANTYGVPPVCWALSYRLGTQIRGETGKAPAFMELRVEHVAETEEKTAIRSKNPW